MAWETINSQYTNVRGANYFPTYPSLNALAGVGWADVTGPAVMWDAYDNDDTPGGTAREVRDQLVLLKKIGFNAIRVWLPYKPTATGQDSYTYVGDKAGFLAKFTHFVAIADDVEMYVIPVIFDSFTVSPNQAETTAILADYGASDASEFIVGLLVVKAAYPTCLLLLDIYNEPWVAAAPAAADVQSLIEAVASQIKTASSAYKTIVGAAGWSQAAPPQAILANANVDVISLHPYQMTERTTPALLADVYDTIVTKPVIATECGANGTGPTYEDAIRGMANIEGVDSRGLGWFIYQAMIGWANVASGFIHLTGTGMMYYDGQLHHLDDALAVWIEAGKDGAAGLYTYAELAALQIATNDALYVPRLPVSVRAGKDYLFKMCYGENRTVNELDAAGLQSIGSTLETFTNYEVVVNSLAQNNYWAGHSVLAIAIKSATFSAAWSGYDLATKKVFILDWMALARVFLDREQTPISRIRRGER